MVAPEQNRMIDDETRLVKPRQSRVTAYSLRPWARRARVSSWKRPLASAAPVRQCDSSHSLRATQRVGLQVAVKDRESSVLREKWRGRRAEGCCISGRGGCWWSCCRDWSERSYSSRGGCSCRISSRRRSEGCCGSRDGGCCEARSGCGSGHRCGSRSERRCERMNGRRNEGGSSGRSEGTSGCCAVGRSSGCCR